MGVTLANFQISGKMPCRKEELKIIANGSHITSPASFISIVGILSGPGAFPFFKCLMELSSYEDVANKIKLHDTRLLNYVF